jgi:hypothetical protein
MMGVFTPSLSDLLADIPFIADCKKIGEHRQLLTDRNTAHENEGRIDYDYQVGQKVLVRNDGIPPQSRVQVSERALANNDCLCEWNNQGSTQK